MRGHLAVMRAVAMPALAWLLGACGGATSRPQRSAEPPTDHCVLALRFETEEPVDDGSDAAMAFPTTNLSLVRICDLAGRVVTSLGRVEGVCQVEPAAVTDWLAADCGWPGRATMHIVVRRDEGDALATLSTVGSTASASGRIALPHGADVRALGPRGRQPTY